MKIAMGKISENLLSLQTSLNQCSGGVRVEAARCKGLLEAKTSGLAEQLNVLSTICTTGFAKVLQVLRTAMADYKEHAGRELCSQGNRLSAVCQSLQSHCGPKAAHCYIEQWADLKKEALESWFKTLDSPKRAMYGYSVSQSVWLTHMDTEIGVGCFLQIHPRQDDSQLEWPFSKLYTIGFIHPKDRSNVISYRVNAGWYKDQSFLQRPNETYIGRFGSSCFSTAGDLELDRFVENDTLHVFLEIKP
ncbi:unnamed protein product [Ixodes pacificus]